MEMLGRMVMASFAVDCTVIFFCFERKRTLAAFGEILNFVSMVSVSSNRKNPLSFVTWAITFALPYPIPVTRQLESEIFFTASTELSELRKTTDMLSFTFCRLTTQESP